MPGTYNISSVWGWKNAAWRLLPCLNALYCSVIYINMYFRDQSTNNYFINIKNMNVCMKYVHYDIMK